MHWLTFHSSSFSQSKSSSSPPVAPMPPCLRSPDRQSFRQSRRSTSPRRHGPRPRSTSLPVATLPLRNCCKDCIPAVDAYLASPAGPERMTLGAKRLQRCATYQGHPTESKVMVDEVDMVRKDLHRVTISESAEEVQESQPESPSSPCKERPTKSGLGVGFCLYDEADECELFPLPSPRSSPRHSPAASPAASQTNLTCPTNRSTPSPIARGNSPLAVCCSVETAEPKQSSELFLKEEAAQAARTESAASPSKAESPPPANPKPRRPSMTGLGTSISKGSLAIVKGFAGFGGNPSI
jgi:hypothetical protein